MNDNSKGYAILPKDDLLPDFNLPFSIAEKDICVVCQLTVEELVKDNNFVAILMPCCNKWICGDDFCKLAVRAQDKDTQICPLCRTQYPKAFDLLSLSRKMWSSSPEGKRLELRYIDNLYGTIRRIQRKASTNEYLVCSSMPNLNGGVVCSRFPFLFSIEPVLLGE